MDITIDLARVIIETNRMILRVWEETNLNDFYEYASVDGVGEMAGWKHHESIDVSRDILQSFIAAKNEFAIVYKQNKKVIGSLGLHCSWANDDFDLANFKLKDIGYVLSKDYWGQGLMVEAVKAVIGFCFEELELDAITCGHSPSNNQSKRVVEKCGFRYVKTSEYYYEEFQLPTYSMRYILFKHSDYRE
jgi:ribosomal-protein-alanine N-acetyltransferase